MNLVTHVRTQKPKYDLEDRLLDYAAEIVELTDAMPRTRSGQHISGQLLRSGTNPLGSHGEGQSAESTADFIHKFSIALKELRESLRWLKLIRRAKLYKNLQVVGNLLDETDQLIRIFHSSIQTAERRRHQPK